MNKELLVKYHNLYGFEVLEDHFPEYMVFRQAIGYFSLATIAVLKTGVNIEIIKKEYEEVGYVCSIKEYGSEEEAHMDLYQHFFNINASKNRAELEYERYYANQSERIGSPYYYVDSPFTIDGIQEKRGLVELLCSSVMKAEEPILCIIEAAAGYGKTCAAYEIYKTLSQIDNVAPIYIELSKNRSAKIFRYVLLDELDRKFSHIKADTVQNEIESGFVPLIIDGFDELISQSIAGINNGNNECDSDFEHAENMLDTIVALLKTKARIFLTSRKSSIFCGPKYEEWLQQHMGQFQVRRVALNEPNIEDWIGRNKVEALLRREVPLADLCNPVILSYLRNVDLEILESVVTSDDIISRYFEMLLSRERDRQSLPMTVTEQYKLFVELAGGMLLFDITSEQREFIAELIAETNDLEKICQRIMDIKPSTEELAYKLAGHVLLDRTMPSRDNIGFINDFVFGTLLGEYVIANPTAVNSVPQPFSDIAITAYSVRSSEKRQALYDVFKDRVPKGSMLALMMDIRLLRTHKYNYCQLQLSSYEFDHYFIMDSHYTFDECVFNQCVFSGVNLITNCFKNCTFIDCMFDGCSFMNDGGESLDNAFYGCTGHDEFVEKGGYSITGENVAEENYEKRVLEQFWPKGRDYAQERLTYRTLLAGFSPKDSNKIDEAIEALKRKKIITRGGQYYFLETKEKISEIREILGR